MHYLAYISFGEHVNDHQIEICEALENEDYLMYYKDGEDFDEKIVELKNKEFKKYVSNNDFLDKLRKEI